ncbi:hypothetical protein ES703_11259 [subsurface metagenome]
MVKPRKIKREHIVRTLHDTSVLELHDRIEELMEHSPLGGYTIPELCELTGGSEQDVVGIMWDMVRPQPKVYTCRHPRRFEDWCEEEFTTETHFFPPHLL